MMVVITILGLLAGMVVMALHGAEESARASKTRATIAKLDNIIRTIYESYRTRRVAMVDPSTGQGTDTSRMDPKVAAQLRLYCLRDLMRMEMPERRTDIANGPLSISARQGPRARNPSGLPYAYSGQTAPLRWATTHRRSAST